MRIEGLHVDRSRPSHMHDLHQPSGVVLVGLVEADFTFLGSGRRNIKSSTAQAAMARHPGFFDGAVGVAFRGGSTEIQR